MKNWLNVGVIITLVTMFAGGITSYNKLQAKAEDASAKADKLEVKVEAVKEKTDSTAAKQDYIAEKTDDINSKLDKLTSLLIEDKMKQGQKTEDKK